MNQVLLSRIKLVLILVRSVTLELSSCISDSSLSVHNRQLKVKRKTVSASYSQDPKPDPVQRQTKWEMPPELLFTALEIKISSWAGGIFPGWSLAGQTSPDEMEEAGTQKWFCLLRMCSEIHESWTIFQWVIYLINYFVIHAIHEQVKGLSTSSQSILFC